MGVIESAPKHQPAATPSGPARTQPAPGRQPRTRIYRSAGSRPVQRRATSGDEAIDAAADSDVGAGGLIVNNGEPVAPGQMERHAFVELLRTSVTHAAAEVLGPTWPALGLGCPYIEGWFSRHRDTDAATIEQIVQRFAGIPRPNSAQDYLEPLLARLRDGIARWQAGQPIGADLADAAAGSESGGLQTPSDDAPTGVDPTASGAPAADRDGVENGTGVQNAFEGGAKDSFENGVQEDRELPFPSSAGRPTLRFGSRGDDVVFLQRRLNLFGEALREDGEWGSLTGRAVVSFQSRHGLAPDAVVGPLTWAELDAELARRSHGPGTIPGVSDLGGSGFQLVGDDVGGPIPQQQQQPNTTKKRPTVNDIQQAGTGVFQPMVSAGFLDQDVACVLRYMMMEMPGNGWATGASVFAANGLGGSNTALFGIVKEKDVADPGLVQRMSNAGVDAAEIDAVKNIQLGSLEAVTVGVGASGGKSVRSLIVVKNDLFIQGQRGPVRGAMMLLTHELNHAKNQAFRLKLDDEKTQGPKGPGRSHYVRPNDAENLPDTHKVRRRFIEEIAGRHAGWHVENEFNVTHGMKGRNGLPAPGALFNASVRYAKDRPTTYGDNGYLASLAGSVQKTLLGEQVAKWMVEVAKMQFTGRGTVSGADVSAYIAKEAADATGRGFSEANATADGLET